MNPFIFDPKKVATVEQARMIVKFYDREIENNVATKAQAENTLNATQDVMTFTHPDMAADFDSLAYAARLVGFAEGERTDLDRMKSQFIMALPYAIRKAIEAP